MEDGRSRNGTSSSILHFPSSIFNSLSIVNSPLTSHEHSACHLAAAASAAFLWPASVGLRRRHRGSGGRAGGRRSSRCLLPRWQFHCQGLVQQQEQDSGPPL